MFAVIKTGGKQYRVAANDEFTIERIPGEAGETVTFKEVLMVGTTIGAPFVEGASVSAEIVAQTRGPKLISFKKRRRQNSRRTRGHRQDLTLIRIADILTDGKQAPAKKAAAPKAKDAKTAEVKSEATAEAPAESAEKPKAKKASGKANDVTRISGLGPAFRDRLAEQGITTLEQIAALTDVQLDELNEAARLQGQPKADDWVGQAKALLAENGEAKS